MKKPKSKEKSCKSYGCGGWLFLGCMFIGIGIGQIAGNVGPFTMLGMGVGFLAMYGAKMWKAQ